MMDFVEHFKTKAPLCRGKDNRRGILEAIEECQRRASLRGCDVVKMEPLQWAYAGFPAVNSSAQDIYKPLPNNNCTERVSNRLAVIGDEIRKKAALKDRDVPNELLKETALEAVWKGVSSIEDVCIGCSDAGRKVCCEHPLFEGGLCVKCKEVLQETFFAVGDDGGYAYCTVCGASGELFVCDVEDCGRVYCIACVDEIGSPSVLEKVQKASRWECFLCCPYSRSSHGFFKARPDWKERIVAFFDAGCDVQVPDLEYLRNRRPLRVLSLFDGLGTGKVALESAGLHIDAYFASETDEGAMLVTQANHGQKIHQLGDVTKITRSMLKDIAPIDLLIGGSPCNELSMANPARRGFDIEGSGVLFFHFYRVKNLLQSVNGSTHLFWLFENVASMKLAHRSLISCFLECQPAIWDAKHFSAQTRTRFFWGNIPGLYSTPEVSPILQRPSDLDSVLHKECQRKAKVQTLRTMTTNPNSLLQGPQQNILPVSMGGSDDSMWICELERLFGFPSHYTDVGNLSPSKRRVLLGRSWSVPVITEIFRPLTRFFAVTADVSRTMPANSCAPQAVAAAVVSCRPSLAIPSPVAVTSSNDAMGVAEAEMDTGEDDAGQCVIDDNFDDNFDDNSCSCFQVQLKSSEREDQVIGSLGTESCAFSDSLTIVAGSSAFEQTPPANTSVFGSCCTEIEPTVFSASKHSKVSFDRVVDSSSATAGSILGVSSVVPCSIPMTCAGDRGYSAAVQDAQECGNPAARNSYSDAERHENCLGATRHAIYPFASRHNNSSDCARHNTHADAAKHVSYSNATRHDSCPNATRYNNSPDATRYDISPDAGRHCHPSTARLSTNLVKSQAAGNGASKDAKHSCVDKSQIESEAGVRGTVQTNTHHRQKNFFSVGCGGKKSEFPAVQLLAPAEELEKVSLRGNHCDDRCSMVPEAGHHGTYSYDMGSPVPGYQQVSGHRSLTSSDVCLDRGNNCAAVQHPIGSTSTDDNFESESSDIGRSTAFEIRRHKKSFHGPLLFTDDSFDLQQRKMTDAVESQNAQGLACCRDGQHRQEPRDGHKRSVRNKEKHAEDEKRWMNGKGCAFQVPRTPTYTSSSSGPSLEFNPVAFEHGTASPSFGGMNNSYVMGVRMLPDHVTNTPQVFSPCFSFESLQAGGAAMCDQSERLSTRRHTDKTVLPRATSADLPCHGVSERHNQVDASGFPKAAFLTNTGSVTDDKVIGWTDIELQTSAGHNFVVTLSAENMPTPNVIIIKMPAHELKASPETEASGQKGQLSVEADAGHNKKIRTVLQHQQDKDCCSNPNTSISNSTCIFSGHLQRRQRNETSLLLELPHVSEASRDSEVPHVSGASHASRALNVPRAPWRPWIPNRKELAAVRETTPQCPSVMQRRAKEAEGTSSPCLREVEPTFGGQFPSQHDTANNQKQCADASQAETRADIALENMQDSNIYILCSSAHSLLPKHGVTSLFSHLGETLAVVDHQPERHTLNSSLPQPTALGQTSVVCSSHPDPVGDTPFSSCAAGQTVCQKLPVPACIQQKEESCTVHELQGLVSQDQTDAGPRDPQHMAGDFTEENTANHQCTGDFTEENTGDCQGTGKEFTDVNIGERTVEDHNGPCLFVDSSETEDQERNLFAVVGEVFLRTGGAQDVSVSVSGTPGSSASHLNGSGKCLTEKSSDGVTGNETARSVYASNVPAVLLNSQALSYLKHLVKSTKGSENSTVEDIFQPKTTPAPASIVGRKRKHRECSPEGAHEQPKVADISAASSLLHADSHCSGEWHSPGEDCLYIDKETGQEDDIISTDVKPLDVILSSADAALNIAFSVPQLVHTLASAEGTILSSENYFTSHALEESQTLHCTEGSLYPGEGASSSVSVLNVAAGNNAAVEGKQTSTLMAPKEPGRWLHRKSSTSSYMREKGHHKQKTPRSEAARKSAKVVASDTSLSSCHPGDLGNTTLGATLGQNCEERENETQNIQNVWIKRLRKRSNVSYRVGRRYGAAPSSSKAAVKSSAGAAKPVEANVAFTSEHLIVDGPVKMNAAKTS